MKKSLNITLNRTGEDRADTSSTVRLGWALTGEEHEEAMRVVRQ
jgi:hypothetical protein